MILNNLMQKTKTKHTPSDYSFFTNCLFDATKNKLDCYRGKDCMEISCKDLRNHALKINDYEKKEIIPLIDEEIKSYEEQKICYICKKQFSTDDEDHDSDDNTKYYKVRDHFHHTGKFRGAAQNICNLRYKAPKEIPVLFHNGFTFDYHFIINQLTKEFKSQLKRLGENTKKYITFFSTT